MGVEFFPFPCVTDPNQENVARMQLFLCFLLVIWGEKHTFAMIL